ncbi:hypothetical protein Hanom_Chr15g01374721 [Helianthus anomalus]
MIVHELPLELELLLPFDHLLKVQGTRPLPPRNPNLVLKIDARRLLPVELDLIGGGLGWLTIGGNSTASSCTPPSLALASTASVSTSHTSKLTTNEPLRARNQSPTSPVTFLHFFTLILTNFGHPQAKASIPSSDTGHPFIHNFFNATHFDAIHDISPSAIVSLPHNANLSNF